MPRPKPPAPTLVLLVRHGQTPTTGAVLPGRAAGLHLSEAGQGQAAKAAERIGALVEARAASAAKSGSRGGARSRAAISAVYASPLERTRETAAPIAKACGLRVKIDKGLLECDFGSWTGKELKVLSKLPEWTTVQRNPSGFRFPGGESFPEMQLRITTALARLCARHPGETIVAVSHADPIKAAAAAALGTHLDLFQRIVVSPCSITAIVYSASGPVVLAVNSTGDDLTRLVPS